MVKIAITSRVGKLKCHLGAVSEVLHAGLFKVDGETIVSYTGVGEELDNVGEVVEAGGVGGVRDLHTDCKAVSTKSQKIHDENLQVQSGCPLWNE